MSAEYADIVPDTDLRISSIVDGSNGLSDQDLQLHLIQLRMLRNIIKEMEKSLRQAHD